MKQILFFPDTFGGDRTQITLMGHSAGAASAMFHTISTRSRPYFQRYVLSNKLDGTFILEITQPFPVLDLFQMHYDVRFCVGTLGHPA